MNASLNLLSSATPGLDASPVQGMNSALNQSPGNPGGGFGVLLQQAVGSLDALPPPDAGAGEVLPLELQGLPQAGKLLPLLQQLLGAARTQGMEPGEVVDDIAARLERLTEGTDLQAGDAIVLAIQQFVEANPRVAGAIDGHALRELSTMVAAASVSDGGRLAQVSTTPGQDAGGRAPSPAELSARADADDDTRLPASAGVRHGALAGDPQPQQPVAGQRDASFSEAVALFRRLAAGAARGAAPETTAQRGDVPPSGFGALSAAPPQPAPAPAAPQTTSIPVPFNQAGWDQALGERIQWLASQGVQRANITLNPANLGPMEVRIQVQNDQAMVHFTAAHGVVRDALEAAMPRLRDMFDSAGVELTDVDVSGQSFAEQQAAAEQHRSARGAAAPGLADTAGEAESILETPVYSRLPSGRLDLFA